MSYHNVTAYFLFSLNHCKWHIFIVHIHTFIYRPIILNFSELICLNH